MSSPSWFWRWTSLMLRGISGSCSIIDSILFTSSSTASTSLVSLGISNISSFWISSSSLASDSLSESSSSSDEFSISASTSSSSWTSSYSWDSSISSSFNSINSRFEGMSSESCKVDLYGILVCAALVYLSDQSFKSWAHYCHYFSPLGFLSGALFAGWGGRPGPCLPANENF